MGPAPCGATQCWARRPIYVRGVVRAATRRGRLPRAHAAIWNHIRDRGASNGTRREGQGAAGAEAVLLFTLSFAQARRFITFIDACYESKTRLFISSEVPIFKIFSDDSSNAAGMLVSDHMRAIMDELVRPCFFHDFVPRIQFPFCARNRTYLQKSWVPHQCLMGKKSSLHLRGAARGWSRWAVLSGWSMREGGRMIIIITLESRHGHCDRTRNEACAGAMQ